MPSPVTAPAITSPVWVRKAMPLFALSPLLLLLAAWLCDILAHSLFWQTVLAGLAALLSAMAVALAARHSPGRLPHFGKNMVQIRNLDDWTFYQYNLPFDVASPEQQAEALKQYRVGLRLFPARPQDRLERRGLWHWLLYFVACASFVTLSQFARGWSFLLVLAAFYVWLWICMRLSKMSSIAAAPNGLTDLDLS